MTTPGGDASGWTPGRRAVLAIFGAIVLVFVVAATLASRYRAATRERLRPPAATATAP